MWKSIICTVKELEQENIKSYWAKRYKEIMSLFVKIKKNHSLGTVPVECYCGYSCREVNEFLRFGYHSDKKLSDKMADILIMTLCSAPKIKDISLFIG